MGFSGLGGELGLEAEQGFGESLQMTALALHGEGEGVGGFLIAFGQGLPDHAGVDGGGFLGLALDDDPQVLGGGRQVAGDAQVIDAMDGLSPGHFLENLGDLGVALLHGALGVGVVLQVSESLGDDGVPEVLLSVGQGGRVGSHSDASVGKPIEIYLEYIISRIMV